MKIYKLLWVQIKEGSWGSDNQGCTVQISSSKLHVCAWYLPYTTATYVGMVASLWNIAVYYIVVLVCAFCQPVIRTKCDVMWGVGINNGTCTCRSVGNIIKLVHSSIMGASLSWLYCDNSYIASSVSDVSTLLVCMALHPQITHRRCSKFSVAPLLIIMNITKQQYSQPIRCFQVTQVRWEVSGRLQFHCLSRLNPLFIPCVCAFTTCLCR